MLRRGITKRGEVAQDQSTSHSHHAAVHSILQSRTSNSNRRNKSSKTRRSNRGVGSSLSSSGSRILSSLSLGVGRAASPSPSASGGRYGAVPSSPSGAGASGGGDEPISSWANCLNDSPPAEEEEEEDAEPEQKQTAFESWAGYSSSPGGQKAEQARHNNNNNNEGGPLSSSSNNDEEGNDNDDDDDASQDQEAELSSEALHKREVEQQLAMALHQQEQRSNNKLRGQSLSRRLLGRRRGRSQQPRSSASSGRCSHQQEKASKSNTIGRSLSPNHFAQKSSEQASSSVKLNLIRQVDPTNMSQMISNSNPAEEYDYDDGESSSPSWFRRKSSKTAHHNHHDHNNHNNSLDRILLTSDEAKPLLLSEDQLQLQPTTTDVGNDLRSSQASSLLSHSSMLSQSLVLNEDQLQLQPTTTGPDLRSSQASLLSQSSFPHPKTQQQQTQALSSANSSSPNGKKDSKSKKLWKKVMKKGGWKKHSSINNNNNNKDGSDFNSQMDKKDSKGLSNDMSRTGRTSETTTTSAPPSPPQEACWDAVTEDPNNKDNSYDNGNGNDTSLSLRDGQLYDNDTEDDAPWAPTMSMLLKTGQLDCIESDSDEDGENNNNSGEGSGFNLNLNTTTTSSNGGGGGGGKVESKSDESDHGSKISNGSRSGGTTPILDDSGRSSSNGFGPDDFMHMPDISGQSDHSDSDTGNQNNGNDNGNHNDSLDSMGKFFNNVASNYLSQRAGHMAWEVDVDYDDTTAISKNDESTLSKEDTVVLSKEASGKRNKKKQWSIENNNGININNNIKALGEKKSRGLSLRSIVGRSRSRGRSKKQDQQTVSSVRDTSSQPETSSAQSQKKGGKDALHRQDTPMPNSNHSKDSSHTDRRSRSRSLFRRAHDNILRKSADNKHPEEEQSVDGLPKSGSPLDIGDNQSNGSHSSNYDNNSQAKRPTRSLPPRKTSSHTPRSTSTTSSRKNSSSFHESRASLFESQSSLELECSDLSLQRQRRKPRRKKCLVCRQKIPRGEGVRYMDLHFCSGYKKEEGDLFSGTCFRCATCRRSLEGEDDSEDDEEEGGSGTGSGNKNDLQIISNARGSIVQCGACAAKSMGLRPAAAMAPSLTMSSCDDDEAEDTRGGSNNSGCLRTSLHLDESDDRDDDDDEARTPLTTAKDVGGNDMHALNMLSKAAKELAEKASVKLGLVASSGRSSEDQHISTLYFMQSEEGNHRHSATTTTNKPTTSSSDLTTTTTVTYELDSDAFGNPNYDGYACSVTNFDDNQETPPRVTSVAMPKLDSDEIDGTIDHKLHIDIRWVDEDGDDESSDGSNSNSMPLQPTGPAMLSIEPFGSTTITKDTVMKVLRQTWEYEENDVTYSFAFVVPFKKIYISWEIEDGDELDLTQCRLEATLKYNPPPQPEPEEEEEELEEEEEAGQGAETVEPSEDDEGPTNESQTANKYESDIALPVTATVNDVQYEDGEDDTLDQSSMPCEVYVRTMSVEQATDSSTGQGSSLILSRHKGALDPDRDENDNFSELLSVASCVKSTIALPSITYIKVKKTEFEGEVGLSLIEKNGATVVAEVSKSGLFANAQIKEGCEILSINGQCIRGPRSVMRIMKDITGQVLIMASNGPSPPGSRFVVKKLKSQWFGNSIQSGKSDSEIEDIRYETTNGLVRVQEISKNGRFDGLPISKGDICLSIDGVPTISSDVAKRALGRSQSIVAMLMFSLPSFWKSIVEFIIDEKYNRWWKKDNVCTLLWGEKDCTPITLTFDENTGLCKADGNEENEVDLRYMNIIIDRVMKLLTASMNKYRTMPKEKVRGSSRSLSVSASGKMNNRADVYRRALIKLDEMRENGTLSADDYEAGRHALATVAIQTAK